MKQPRNEKPTRGSRRRNKNKAAAYAFTARDISDALDLEEQGEKEQVMFKQRVIIESVEKFDGTFIAGIYKTSYWGHSYENVDFGIIPADSLSINRQATSSMEHTAVMGICPSTSSRMR